MQVGQIWVYPVKSMLGGVVHTAEIADKGIVGDRRWTLRDERRGAIASARTIAGLTRLAAEVTADGVRIRLPDGSEVSSGDRDANERLSAAVGHPVTLWSMQTDDSFWLRGTPGHDDFMVELRSIFGRIDDEPLPDLSIFPPEMMTYEYPPGSYHDAYPLMIMSTSALRSLREALPGSVIDVRRFRPSLVVDTGDAPGHPEFGWVGHRVRIGSTLLEIRSACPRCVAITREFGTDVPADRQVLRHVVRDLDQAVGVYATVIEGGSISTGDPVEID